MTDKSGMGLDWTDVRVFLALARHGSLSAAARALSVNHATIARRIGALEAALGTRLVERRPDGYVLTPAGARALGPAGEMEAAAAALGRDGADGGPKGLVRLNAPPSLAQAFLIECLAPLCIEHPGLDIDIATDLRPVSLERREADIALRLAAPQDGDVVARRLAPLGFGFYATPGWHARIEAGEAPDFIGFDEINASVPEAMWLARHFPRARISFRAGSHLAQALAARAGAGIALLPHFVGRQDALLVRCRLAYAPPTREICLITRREDRADLPIGIVVDRLIRAFAEARALFDDDDAALIF